ncbi:hypothetical protein [Catenuloplanes atrovinosus]|uniref:Tetratricopeptide (TPR) repeat protein n=1 Tax=Catenuloplanes atrovinosus TaxID=137266 RepID=A0AAE4CAM8_9ACTN|nr:hypothetical protein [Catenuloplanes atrovinosus]MDR7275984.1 tetratricopeptide (TPR) repeat protein [Catenuloplanes atrovinosus]
MVRVPWRREPSPDEADRLVAVADELAMLHGPGPGANQAAIRAVEAARKLAAHGDRADRGRLLHALGRLGVNVAMGRTPDDATPVVQEVIALARALIAEPGPGGDDPVRAEAVVRLVQSAQIVENAGGRARARDMVEEALAAAPDVEAGPHARRARAAVLAALVQNRVVDQEERIAQRREPVDGAETMRLAIELVDTARAVAIADEGPAIYDLAEALSFLGRAALVVDRPDLTGAAWAEQLSILMSFDGGGAKARFAQASQAIGALGKAFPRVEVVIPGPDAWRRTPSYADRWRQPGTTAPSYVRADGLEDFDRRLEEAIALSRGGARLTEAERSLDRLVAEVTVSEAGARGTPEHPEFQRVLARALWRLAQVRHAAGRATEALEPARLSTVYAAQRLDRLLNGTPARQRAVADAITYLCDAGEIAFAAGHPEERVEMLRDAIRLGERASDAPVRRAVGTALHNLATAHAATLSRGARDAQLRAETVALSDRARTIRRGLVDEAEPLTVWEYANTLVMCVGVAALGQRWADGVAHLTEAAPLLARLGPAASEMTARARMHAQMLGIVAPRLVAEARAAGRWPY